MNAPALSAPGLVVGFYFRTEPETDSHESWKFEILDLSSHEDLADLERFAAERLDANVLGQVLDLTGLDDEEREQLARAAADGDLEHLGAVLPRLPRLTTPGVDLDFDDPAAVTRLKVGFDRYFAARGARLRWTRSGGPSSAHEHGELGPAEPGAGHPELMRAAFGLFRDACRSLGLAPRGDHAAAGDYWVEADDPTGERGSVDLSPVNRSPEARGSLFRPLDGLTKDRRARKALSAGSPATGSPWTQELVEEGLRLWRAQEDAAGRGRRAGKRAPKIHPRPEDLPNAAKLPELTAWVMEVMQPQLHHELRKCLSAVLIRSGLVRSHWGIEAMAVATGNLPDSRGTWASTEARIKVGAQVTGAGKLRQLVGVVAYEGLVWAIFSGLQKRGARNDYTDVAHRLGLLVDVEPHDLASAAAAVRSRLAAKPADPEPLEAMLGRLTATKRCAKRSAQHEECSCCDRPGAPKKLHCRMVELCRVCARRDAERGLAAALPAERCDLAVATFATRRAAKVARKDVRRWARQDGRAEPQIVTSPAPGGRTQILVYGAAGSGRCVEGLGWDGKAHPADLRVEKSAAAGLVRGWICRALVARHVQARAILERGDAGDFVDLCLALYRRQSVGAGTLPTAAGMTEWRMARAKAHAARADEPAPEWCACSPLAAPPAKRRWRVLDETGRPLIGGLKRRPTLVQAVALEDGAVDLPLGAQRLRL